MQKHAYNRPSVSFVSPAAPGTYRSNWRVQSPDGQRFGQQFYVQIVVPEPTATPTNAAVRDLQKVYGLTVDGIVGPQTWKALVVG